MKERHFPDVAEPVNDRNKKNRLDGRKKNRQHRDHDGRRSESGDRTDHAGDKSQDGDEKNIHGNTRWGLINAIGTANQRVGKEKDDCR